MKQLTPGTIESFGNTTTEKLHGVAEALRAVLSPDYAEIIDHTEDETPEDKLTLVVNDKSKTTFESEVSSAMFRWKNTKTNSSCRTSYDIGFKNIL